MGARTSATLEFDRFHDLDLELIPPVSRRRVSQTPASIEIVCIA